MTEHDGDDRSSGATTGNYSLGVSRVRPGQDPHRRRSGAESDTEGHAVAEREPQRFDAASGPQADRERWKAIAVVLFVLVTLALLGELSAQVAAGVDVLALGPAELGLLDRVDAALATAETGARLLAAGAGAFAALGTAVVGLVAVIRARA